MPNYTPNYNLKKPEPTDNYNVADQNGNMDLIEAALDTKETPAGAQAKVNAAITALLNGAPGALDTLNELADALGDDPSFATTITNLIATKADQTTVATHLADYTLQIPYGGTTTNVGAAYATAIPAIAALTIGMAISVKFNAASVVTSTLNWNAKGAKGIKKSDGTDFKNIKLNGVYTLRYDGTNFILQGEGASGDAIASDLLSGKKAGTDAGDIVGTMPDRAGDTAALASSIVGTTLKLRASNGYRDGVNDNVTLADANFTAANLKDGVTVHGLLGELEGKQDIAGYTSSTSYVAVGFIEGEGNWVGSGNNALRINSSGTVLATVSTTGTVKHVGKNNILSVYGGGGTSYARIFNKAGTLINSITINNTLSGTCVGCIHETLDRVYLSDYFNGHQSLNVLSTGASLGISVIFATSQYSVWFPCSTGAFCMIANSELVFLSSSGAGGTGKLTIGALMNSLKL